MRAGKLGILLATLLSTEAAAESCSRLYNAVKQEAMYCGFFCDQRRLAPLQQAYETNCIVVVVPLAFLASFENSSDDSEIASWSDARNDLVPSTSPTFPF
jgi:hypothetical protein